MKKMILFFTFLLTTFLAVAQTDRKEVPNISIYPNPMISFFEVGNSDAVKEIRVINLAGRQVRLFGAVNGERYDVADLPTGMYLLQIVGKNNRILITQRISKRS